MMTPALDIGRIDIVAMENGRALLQRLAPGGKLRSLEYVAPNGGGVLGSTRIHYKTGKWADDATGASGQGVASWLAYLRKVTPDEAAREIAAALEIAPEGAALAMNGADAAPAPVVETNGAAVIELQDRRQHDAAAELPRAISSDPAADGIASISGALASAEPQKPDDRTEYARLAQLSRGDYDRERDAAAKRLGIRTSTLDDEVKKARGESEAKGQGRAFQIEDVEPWDGAVSGAALLDDMTAAIRRYVVMPSGAAETVALWAVHTHCFDAFMNTPRLAIQSPEKGCGKTTLLDTIACLVARPLPTSNVTAAVVFRVVEMARPTLLVDEADTFLKDNEQLRGVLNSGHRRGGAVLRTEGENLEPRQFATHAPAAIALIGRLPDTLEDRSVAISLRRRKPSERVESFRSDRAQPMAALARQAARWCADNRARLGYCDPDMGELFNRTADNWRPLFAIADAAGGPWPDRVRQIASASAAARDEQSIRVQLLADIKWILDGQPEADDDGQFRPKSKRLDQIAGADLAADLAKIEGRPWGDWKAGKAMTAGQLARQLGHFQIQSHTIWFRDSDGHRTSLKGYTRADFAEAFECYLPHQSVTPSQPLCRSDCDAFKNGTPESGVTLSKTSQPLCRSDCDGVTLSNPYSGETGEEIDI